MITLNNKNLEENAYYKWKLNYTQSTIKLLSMLKAKAASSKSVTANEKKNIQEHIKRKEILEEKKEKLSQLRQNRDLNRNVEATQETKLDLFTYILNLRKEKLTSSSSTEDAISYYSEIWKKLPIQIPFKKLNERSVQNFLCDL